MKLLTTIEGGGEKPVNVYLDNLGGREIITFLGDADIDADGANGQRGGRVAYNRWDTGSELLENGGMKVDITEQVRFTETWGKDIIVTNAAGEPYVDNNGSLYSKTAYYFPNKMEEQPDKYLDSETINYICIPPQLRKIVKGVVLGCFCQVRHERSGVTISAMVGDIGPRKKTGEISISLARQLGLNPSPRIGGTNDRIIRYTIFPGQSYMFNGFAFPLLPV